MLAGVIEPLDAPLVCVRHTKVVSAFVSGVRYIKGHSNTHEGCVPPHGVAPVEGRPCSPGWAPGLHGEQPGLPGLLARGLLGLPGLLAPRVSSGAEHGCGEAGIARYASGDTLASGWGDTLDTLARVLPQRYRAIPYPDGCTTRRHS